MFPTVMQGRFSALALNVPYINEGKIQYSGIKSPLHYCRSHLVPGTLNLPYIIMQGTFSAGHYIFPRKILVFEALNLTHINVGKDPYLVTFIQYGTSYDDQVLNRQSTQLAAKVQINFSQVGFLYTVWQHFWPHSNITPFSHLVTCTFLGSPFITAKMYF